MPVYQPVNLRYCTQKKVLTLELPDNPKRINVGLAALFSPVKNEIVGVGKAEAALEHIREVPSYHQLIATLQVNQPVKGTAAKTYTTTVSNLQLYLVFHQALNTLTPYSLITKVLRRVIGMEPHLKSMQAGLLVPTEIDSAHFYAQVNNLIGFLPSWLHGLFGIAELDQRLAKLHRKRAWQQARAIPQRFEEQFPEMALKAPSGQEDDGVDGGGGHNMLNPRRTQEPQPKDDTTPLKTKPGRK